MIDIVLCKNRYNTLNHDVIQDLKQEGAIGLMKAVRTYDPSKGASFRTYASWKIWSAMADHLRYTPGLPAIKNGKHRHGKVVQFYESFAEEDGTPYDTTNDVQSQNFETEQKLESFRKILKQKLIEHGASKRLAKIALLRFGYGLTMREIGKRLRLTESRVCQISNDHPNLIKIAQEAADDVAI